MAEMAEPLDLDYFYSNYLGPVRASVSKSAPLPNSARFAEFGLLEHLKSAKLRHFKKKKKKKKKNFVASRPPLV